ncbi:hypothetical protein FB451DRAFT_1171673 [Mycena latifolia]|nr:hypothetical protein FB451DRAFT_1171673 [Mycena latifolia]
MQEEFWEDTNSALKYSGGSAIKLMGAQGWDHGSFRVVLDGKETIVDGHYCAPNGGVPQVIQFEATGLGTSEHVLNIANLAAGPRGTALEIDALMCAPIMPRECDVHVPAAAGNRYFRLLVKSSKGQVLAATAFFRVGSLSLSSADPRGASVVMLVPELALKNAAVTVYTAAWASFYAALPFLNAGMWALNRAYKLAGGDQTAAELKEKYHIEKHRGTPGAR